VVQTVVPSTLSLKAMKSVKLLRKVTGSVIRGRSCRHSLGSRRTFVQPVPSPSIRVSEHIQARFSSQPAQQETPLVAC